MQKRSRRKKDEVRCEVDKRQERQEVYVRRGEKEK